MTDTIIKIQPSDLISDSMVKINHNFEIISTRDDVTESKLNQWAENIETQLNDIRNENGIISSTILNNVNKLENKINNLTDLDGITKEVQNAINSATIDVENLISEKAGEAISSRLGDYVKTSTLNGILDGYVASITFDTYKSDSSKSSAQSSRIVANSKFLKLPNDDNGGVECLVRITGEITGFESVEDYFKSLSASEKAEILGGKTFSSDDKALEDPNVVAKLIEVCERTFKTVVSQMSIISQTVGPDNVENSIIAAVNGENGKQISASIFAKANEKNSEIYLNADNIKINSGKTLNVQSGGNINIESGGSFQVNSNNFKIDSSGNVTVKGAIEATSLKINGTSGLIDISDETKLSNFIKSHQDTASGDVEWLKNALNNGTTTIDGGLVLSNAILTKDSNDNITAGMIGENTSGNDVRFFAGTNATITDKDNAPFRVYEDGSLISNAGKIGPLTIKEDGFIIYNNASTRFPVAGLFTEGAMASDREDAYPIFVAGPPTVMEATGPRAVLNASLFKVYSDGYMSASSGTIGGLNIHEDGSLTTDNGNFSLSYDGVLTAKMGSFGGFLKMPFKSFDEGATYNSSDQTYTVSNSFNLQSIASHWSGSYEVTLKLPSSSTFSGSVLTIFDSPVKTKSSPGLIITCEQNAYIYHPSRTSSTYGLAPATSINCTRGGVIQFVCVNQGSYNYWVVISDAMPEAEIS